MTQVQSALNRAITNYEMRFGGGDANQQKTRLERIKRAIDVVARATLERLRREGRSLKYYIALKLTFHKASDVLTVTDPPITFTNGEAFVLLPGQDIEAQLEMAFTNLLKKIDDFQRVRAIDISFILKSHLL